MFKKYLSLSIIVHILGVIIFFGCTYLIASPERHEVNLTNSKQIKGVTDEQIIKSIAISQSELNESLSRYNEQRTNNEKKLISKKRQLLNIEYQLRKKQNLIDKKEKELISVEKNINEIKKKEYSLKESEIKKKRNAEIKKQRELVRKEKILQDKIKEDKIKQKLEEQKKANEAALKEITQRNEAIEKREMALLRGKYESEIHKLLYDAWILPYDRLNVRCPVELSLSPDGNIIDFKFLTDCPVDYKQMIDLAISRVKKLPKIASKIFKAKEVVNFIDSVE